MVKTLWGVKREYDRHHSWDGTIVEATTARQAIYIMNSKNELRLYEYYIAIPESWDLPLEIYYTQPELF